MTKTQEDFYKQRSFGTEHLDYYSNIVVPAQGDYLDIGCADFSGIKLVEKTNSLIHLSLIRSYGIDVYKSTPNTIVCDLNKDIIPFDENTFDVISSFETVEHINYTEHYIREIYRVLKQDGTLFISTPNLSWWVNRILLCLGFQPANTEVDIYHSMYGKPKLFKDEIGSGHIHVFTKKAILDFLNSNGFKIIKTIPDWSHYEGKLKLFSLIDKIISHIPGLARGYVYVCKRKKE